MKIINPGELDSISIINENFYNIKPFSIDKHFKNTYNNKIIPRVIEIDWNNLNEETIIINDKPDETLILNLKNITVDNNYKKLVVFGQCRINKDDQYFLGDNINIEIIDGQIEGNVTWQYF